MRVILRRELIGKTAVMVGTAAAPLLTKAALAQTQADGRSNMSNVRLSSLVDALHAYHPAADRADKMGLYGWVVGAGRSSPYACARWRNSCAPRRGRSAPRSIAAI